MPQRRKILYTMAAGAGLTAGTGLVGWGLRATDSKDEYSYEPGMDVELKPQQEVRGDDWELVNKGLEDRSPEIWLGEGLSQEINGERYYDNQREIKVKEGMSHGSEDHGLEIPEFRAASVDSGYLGLDFL